MPRATWTHFSGRPRIQVEIRLAAGAQQVIRDLLADTGAGNNRSTIDLIMTDQDCRLCGAIPSTSAALGGAFVGTYPVYNLRILVPALGFNRFLRAVGVPSIPHGFGGVACLRFLERFTYGNFGVAGQFSLEI